MPLVDCTGPGTHILAKQLNDSIFWVAVTIIGKLMSKSINGSCLSQSLAQNTLIWRVAEMCATNYSSIEHIEYSIVQQGC